MNSIQSYQSSLSQIARPPETSTTGGADVFKDFLLDSIREVNAMQVQADQAVEQFATGGDVNPAEVLTAVQKADIAFKMMLQVRNKLVQAYEEVQAIRI
ncbi:MAG: flagellar hook-basal body complex protein FliE [Planctomycetota bacterium]